MADFPMMPFWTDAYTGDTMHLRTIEHGAYLLLLVAAWRSPKCALPDDDAVLARIARCDGRTWKKLRPVVMDFFTLEGAEWTQKRLLKERTNAHSLRNKRRSSGAAGGRQTQARNRLKTKEPEQAPLQAPLKQTAKQNQAIPSPSPSLQHSKLDTGGNPGPKSQPKSRADSRSNDFHTVSAQIAKIMDVDNDPNWLGNFGPVHQWLADGADPETVIYPTVAAVMERFKATNAKPPGTLSYFNRPIAEALERDKNGLAENGKPKQPEDDFTWARRQHPELFKSTSPAQKRAGE
jgi:uncharacterized protein YdaU (DUF1376 family)